MKGDKRPLMVSIWCMTYNHEPYIRQCLDGFVMQKTNFRFEAIVHDDASTDETAAIVKEYSEKYPDIIKPVFETENQYSKRDGSLDRIMEETCTGKYIALCEGDDYWIDPLKLQEQADFMESHPDCSLIHSRFSILNDDNNKIEEDDRIHFEMLKLLKNKKTNIGFEILNHNRYRIQTVTALFRRDLYNIITNETKSEIGLFLMGDTQLWMNLLNYGYIYYYQKVTSVYRIQNNSTSRTDDPLKKARFIMSAAEMRLFYAKKYKIKGLYFYFDYFNFLIKYKHIYPNYKSDERIIKLSPIISFIFANKIVVKIVRPFVKLLF